MTGCLPAFHLGLAVAAVLAITSAAPVPVDAEDSPPRIGQVEQVPRDQAVAILGRQVAAPDGKTIGRLVDVLVDASGTPEAAVIDFGGFLGVGARQVAVHWSTLAFAPSNAKQPITLDLTPDQIKAVPEYRDPNKAAPVVVPTTAEPQSGNAAGQSPSGTP
jgi:PRC-barrel domain